MQHLADRIRIALHRLASPQRRRPRTTPLSTDSGTPQSLLRIVTAAMEHGGITSTPRFLERESQILEIRDGILFVVAEWSACATLYLNDRLRILGSSFAALPQLYFIDSDLTSGDFFPNQFGKQKGGYCETLWFQDGHLVHALWAKEPNSRALVQEFTRAILT